MTPGFRPQPAVTAGFGGYGTPAVGSDPFRIRSVTPLPRVSWVLPERVPSSGRGGPRRKRGRKGSVMGTGTKSPRHGRAPSRRRQSARRYSGTVVTGLGLRARPSGRKLWFVHRRVGNAVTKRTLSVVDAMSVEDVRRAARRRNPRRRSEQQSCAGKGSAGERLRGRPAQDEAGIRLKSEDRASEGTAPRGRNPPWPYQRACMRSITPCSAAASLAGSRHAPSRLRLNAGAISKRIPIRKRRDPSSASANPP